MDGFGSIAKIDLFKKRKANTNSEDSYSDQVTI